MCGEQLGPVLADPQAGGSSPRVRGTAWRLWSGWPGRRIIPACAGNRCERHRSAGRRADHPRVCGEQYLPRYLPCQCLGSSPRVRGTGGGEFNATVTHRIIPACAGNRALPLVELAIVADHPRVCGEQSAGAAFAALLAGSSPRVRGTAMIRPRSRGLFRIIPACAGNRSRGAGHRAGWADHPRVCGEQDFLAQCA